MPYKPQKKQRPWQPKRKPFSGRIRDNSKFYNSRRWRKVALLFRDQNPTCKHCTDAGTVGPADVADHIPGLNYLLDNGLDPYDPKYLQSLCHPHHNKKSGSERHNKPNNN